MIAKEDIEYLFEELWPQMPYAVEHQQNCLDKLESIDKCFIEHRGKDDDKLLTNLMKFDGIKITIASGLIWSVKPKDRVPFDKYTLGYAIQKKIILNDKVSSNYVKYSEKIKEFCDSQPQVDERQYEIEDFVREAMVNCDKMYLIEPK